MKYFILIGFVLAGLQGECQSTRIFFNKEHKIIKDSAKAKFYAVVEKVSDTAWKVTEYQSNKFLLSTGFYKDEKLKVQHGVFTYYEIGVPKDPLDNHFFSFIEVIGSYENGEKSGDWIYYRSDGHKSNLNTYKNGKMDGLYQTYADSNKVLAEGYYRNDKREGEWHVYDKNGKVMITDTYSAGKVVSSIRANPDSIPPMGRVLNVVDTKVEKDKATDITTVRIYTDDNNEQKNAYPDCDFNALLLKKINNSIDKSADGLILIQIFVLRTGKVGSISLMKGLGNDTDDLVRDIVHDLCTWHPAIQDKKSIDQFVYCTIKIRDSKVAVKYGYSIGEVTKN